MPRLCKDWLKTYMEFTAQTEAPPHFHFWAGVGVLGGALRRKTYFPMLHFKWSPNFYIILVARPGISTKSTTLGIGRSLLKEVQDVKIGPDALTWQALVTEFAAAAEGVLMPDGLYHTHSNLSFFISEMGTFLDFQDRTLIDNLTHFWDGTEGPYTKATATMGSHTVINPFINIIGATTPAWLADNLPRQMIDGGFTSRCVWLYSEAKKMYIAYPQRRVVLGDHEAKKANLIHDLEHISTLRGEFWMTEDAYKLGEEWYEKHQQLLEAMPEGNDGLGGYMARKQGHIHKLAMVISASYKDDLSINAEDFRKALVIMEEVEKDYPKIFRSISTSTEMEDTARIIALVRSKGRISRTALYQFFIHRLSAKAFSDAIDAGIQAGYLTQEVLNNVLYVSVAGSLAPPSQKE